jgi:hypothetical protein
MSDELIGIDVFENALLVHRDMPLDAMSHAPETLNALFVPYGQQVQRMNTPTWQIVFGGPGTGKTHLLRVYEQLAFADALARRPSGEVYESLPIYIDASSLTSRLFMDDHERRAQACFRNFLEVFRTNLETAVEGLKARDGLYARLRNSRRDERNRRALAILEQILNALDDVQLHYPYGDHQIESTQERHTSQRNTRTLGVDVGVSREGPHAEANIRGEREGGESSGERVRQQTHGSSEPPWYQIRTLIASMCKELQVRRLDLLIDNWPALDTFGNTGVQPHFAELLKKAFGGDRGGHAISVKIAADGLATRLWDRGQGVGLRVGKDIVGRDIETVVNLNLPLLDDEELIAYFERLLFGRLCACEERLRYLLDPDTLSRPVHPSFIHTIFGDGETFELLVKGAEGRIRLFIHLVRELTERTNGNLSEPFSRDLILDVITRRGAQEASEYQYRSLAVQLLLVEIKPEIVARDHAVFAITDVEFAKFRSQLEELDSKALLEAIVPEPYRREASEQLRAFAVSNNLMEEWHRARSIEQHLKELLEGELSTARQLSLEELRIYLEGGAFEAPG